MGTYTIKQNAERILTPNAHWKNIGEDMGRNSSDPCKWAVATVIQILKKKEYIGWKILNKTTEENYKAEFVELVKKHTEFTALTTSLLNEFIEKVVVHEAVKVDGKREQAVDIYLNFIGKFDLSLSEYEQEEAPIRTSKKKLRSEMTEEQVRRERERDKVRYAQKVAAKKAPSKQTFISSTRVKRHFPKLTKSCLRRQRLT